jgi:putative transcriptional regulator
MPNHHPDESLLIEYAAGSLGEAKALLVATHSALCLDCRATIRAAEAVGGALLSDRALLGDGAEEVALGAVSDLAVMPPTTELTASRVSPALCPVPNPLRDYLGHSLGGLHWRPVWRGMNEYALPQFLGGVRLLWIPGGRRMPRHGHDGEELTLVLQGSFADQTGQYVKGDVATADGSIDHQPVAGPGEVCLCLAVEDGPLHLTGWTGRLLTAASALSALLPGKRD